jgi:hypothetical protein
MIQRFYLSGYILKLLLLQSRLLEEDLIVVGVIMDPTYRILWKLNVGLPEIGWVTLSRARTNRLIVFPLDHSSLRDDFIQLILGLLNPALHINFLRLFNLSRGL